MTRSPVASSGSSDSDRRLLVAVAEPVWMACAAAVLRHHRARAHERCDVRIRFAPELRYEGSCLCLTLYVETLVDTVTYLGGVDPAHVRTSYAAMAFTHARRRVEDAARRERGTRSLSRVSQLPKGATYRALGTPELRALFLDVASEAGSHAPLDGMTQLHRRLAEKRAERVGGAWVDHVSGVRRDLVAIEEICDRTAPRRRISDSMPGTPTRYVSWWQGTIERGLGMRGHAFTVPLEVERDGQVQALELADVVDVAEQALGAEDDEAAVVAAITHAAADRPHGTSAVEALVAAIRDLGERGVLSEHVVARFLADTDAHLEALAGVRGLVRAERADRT